MKVTEIGEYAFLGCCNLRELSLPRTVRRTLGEGLFPRMYRSAHGCPSFRTDGIAPLSFCLVRES